MPPVGKLSEATEQAVVRLGAEDSLTHGLTLDAKNDAIVMALAWYSGLRPRVKLYEVVGDGTKRRYPLTGVVSGWVKRSEVGPVQLVTSPDTDDEKVTDLVLDEWEQRVAGNGDDVLMLTAPVPTTTTLRVSWEAPHVVDKDDASLTSIPEKDADAFISMTAAFMARWISRRASNQAAPSLGVDQIDAEPISERWKRRATELEKCAMERLSPTKESVSSAGASIEWDTVNSASARIGH